MPAKMFQQLRDILTFSAIVSQVMAGAVLPQRRAAMTCYPGEEQDLMCFVPGKGTPQDVRVEDVQWAAEQLREYATTLAPVFDEEGKPVKDDEGNYLETTEYRFLNMSLADAGDCGEWTIFTADSALILAKLMTSEKGGLVWYGDIADAIDGGEAASEDAQAGAILSCGEDGGSREVYPSLDHEAYEQHLGVYESGLYAAEDIVIKIVANLEWQAGQDDEEVGEDGEEEGEGEEPEEGDAE